jgi:hypothetical protein
MKIQKHSLVLIFFLFLGLFTSYGLLRPNTATVHAAQPRTKAYKVTYSILRDSRNTALVKVAVTNNRTTAIKGWTLSWDFPGDQQITWMWNGTYTQDNTKVTITNSPFNSRISARRSINIYFYINYSGSNDKPTNFTFNNAPVPTATSTARPTSTPRITPTPMVTVTPNRPTASAVNTPIPSTSGKIFYTSSVNDNLDANDRVLFESYFKNMGYTLSGSNTDISSSQLKSILSRSNISLFYHTGHGYDSGIATSDGTLSVSNVSEVNVSTFIIATCLTLTSSNWKNKMSSTCSNILGYTNTSFDGTDDDIVKSFANKVKSGSSMIQAWYSANIASSNCSDRWCGYVREGSSIVEYSARTSNTPKTTATNFKSMNSRGNLKVAANLLADNNTYDSYFFKIRNSEITIKDHQTPETKFYHKATAFLPKVAMDRDQAVATAANWAAGSLPTDAVQDAVTQIIATEDSGRSQVVGQIVRYTRYLDGLAVRTNGTEDHLAILVADNGVNAVSKLWPTLETKSKPGAIPYSKILSLSKAIQKASPKIARLIKANNIVAITAAHPCYGATKQGKLVPAYELIDTQGGRIIINAVTGELVL